MRRTLRLLVAVAVAATALSPVTAQASSSDSTRSARMDHANVMRILYSTPIDRFVAMSRTGDTWLDWSTDFCSAPLVGTTGRSFDFHDACRRHDFAYRNLRLLEQRYGTGGTYWNSSTRRRADELFLADMKSHCSRRPWYGSTTCRGWADTYYRAVRIFGGP